MGPCKPQEVQQGQMQGAAPGTGRSQAQYRLGEGTESSATEKDLGASVDEKLHMSHRRALAAQKANHI